HRLNRFHGFSLMDAYHLLGQVGEVRACQLVGDFQAAMVKIRRDFFHHR
ncbi:MAG: hypothetical protein JRH07_13560, partial [Deltaproteobacteria bacterium]|nr:hypothetical protein [Deltaproteobacteria bacterium]